MTTSYIPTNAKGYRLGEMHQNADLTDREVELVRQLREQGMKIRELAEKFEISEGYVKKLTSYRARNQTAVAYRRS